MCHTGHTIKINFRTGDQLSQWRLIVPLANDCRAGDQLSHWRSIATRLIWNCIKIDCLNNELLSQRRDKIYAPNDFFLIDT